MEIRRAIGGTGDLYGAIINLSDGDLDTYQAFQRRPSSENRLWVNRLVEPVSDWAFLEMMDVLDNRRPGSAYEFYCAIKARGDCAELARRTFEYHLHEFLKTSSQTFAIESR